MEDMTYQEITRKYYRLITGIDVQVGRIVEELSSRDLHQNTVIIFTSDNGYLLGDRGLIDKYVMYEESIRVPLIIMDPRTEVQGISREEMALNIDIAPTILDLAGVETPAWMNGRSLRPLLGPSKGSWRDEWFYEHLFDWGSPGAFPKMEGVRTTRWKYVRWIDQTPVYEQLFDLLNDPGELHSLVDSAGHRRQLQALRATCDLWVRSLEKWNRSEAWHEPVASYLKDAL
jgi:arylsulfatase A-like enzyme